MANYTIKIQDVYNSILDETKPQLVVVKGAYDKCFVGPLFFEIDAFECLKGDAHKYVVIEEPTGADIVIAAYELLKEFDMLNKDTLKTMAHWQYMNGVTNNLYSECYKDITDEELLKLLQ